MNFPSHIQAREYAYFEIDGKPAFGGRQWLEALKFHQPGLAPVRDGSGWYHIDLQGKPVYEQRYKRVFGYYFDRAAVIDWDGNWFHIDPKGQRIYAENYAWAGNYQEGLCPVRDFDGNYFHIDLSGRRIYKESYRYTGDFKDGYAAVRLQDGYFMHIDKTGKPLNGKKFLDLGVFHKNFATARDERGWYHIDLDGNELYPQRYQMIEPFYNGFALVTTFDGKKVIINEKGKILFSL